MDVFRELFVSSVLANLFLITRVIAFSCAGSWRTAIAVFNSSDASRGPEPS